MTAGASSLELIASLVTGFADVTEFTPSRVGGRLHPAIVHFPIALVFSAAAVETWRAIRREPGLSSATPPLLVAAAITAVVSAGSGWLNAAWELTNDTTDSLFWHRWLGTASAVLLIAVAAIAWRSRRAEVLASLHVAGRFGAILAAVFVAIVGHFGGDVVRGDGFIFEALHSRASAKPAVDDTAILVPSSATAPPVDPEKAAYFLASVRPILDTHCIECHGERKQKGGLRLTPIGAAFVGRLNDWAIVPRRPESSELMHRIELPADDVDAMPPRGDRLTSAEIEIIRKWIADGAVVPTTEWVETSRKAAQAPALDIERAVQAIAERGAIVQPIFVGSPKYELNASLASPTWTDADVVRLAALSSALVAVNLARSAITDDAIARLVAMPELVQLRLDRTAITDRAVLSFLEMPKLETLNLVGTGVTDAGLEQLTAHRSLRRVYVWESKVTADGARRAMALHPDLDIVGAPTQSSVPIATSAP